MLNEEEEVEVEVEEMSSTAATAGSIVMARNQAIGNAIGLRT